MNYEVVSTHATTAIVAWFAARCV